VKKQFVAGWVLILIIGVAAGLIVYTISRQSEPPPGNGGTQSAAPEAGPAPAPAPTEQPPPEPKAAPVAPEPVPAEPEPAVPEAKPAPAEPVPAPSQPETPPAEAKPAQPESAPAEAKPAPAGQESAPAEAKPAPSRPESAPVEGKPAPAQPESPPAETKPAPGQAAPETAPAEPKPAPQLTVEEHARRAQELYGQKDYKTALQEYEQVLKAAPGNVTALYNTACVASLLGNKEQALDYLKRAIEAGWRDGGWMEKDTDLDAIRGEAGYKDLLKNLGFLKRAEDFYRQGDYQNSLKEFEEALKVNPKDVNALYNTACVHSLLGNKEQAVMYLKKAVEAGWRDVKWMEKDTDLNAIRDEPAYQEILRSLTAPGPVKDHDSAPSSMIDLQKRPQCEIAIPEHLAVLCSNEPVSTCPISDDSPGADLTKADGPGAAGADRGSKDLAPSVVPQGMSRWDALDVLVSMKRSDEFYAQKDYRSALKELEHALALDPRNVGVLYNAACMHSLLGEKSQALAQLKRAVKAGWRNSDGMEKDADLASVRGEAEYKAILAAVTSLKKAEEFYRKKDYRSSLAEFQKALKGDPNDMNALYNAARVCSLLGDKAQAVAYLRKAVKAGWCDMDSTSKDPDLKAIRGEPGYRDTMAAMASFTRAWELYSKKDYRSALGEYQKVLKADPKDAAALYNTACVYSLLGDKAQAVAYLKKAVEAGWDDAEWTEKDADLEAVRGEAGYKEALKSIAPQ